METVETGLPLKLAPTAPNAYSLQLMNGGWP